VCGFISRCSPAARFATTPAWQLASATLLAGTRRSSAQCSIPRGRPRGGCRRGVERPAIRIVPALPRICGRRCIRGRSPCCRSDPASRCAASSLFGMNRLLSLMKSISLYLSIAARLILSIYPSLSILLERGARLPDGSRGVSMRTRWSRGHLSIGNPRDLSLFPFF